MLNEDAKWIYESMSAKGYDLQSEEHFEELLKNNEDAKWIYDESSKIGLDLGDYTHFEDLIGKVDGATKEADIIKDDESLPNSKKRDGYQTMIDSHTSFAEKHIKEQEEKKAQQAKVQDNYLNAGLSEQDKTDRAEYEKLMSDKAMNQISETFGIEQPKVNQYGMPVVESAKEEADLTTISRPRTVGTGEEVIPFKSSEQKVDEKIAAMPSYITRGEDDTHKINANAFERALNTKEGKELYKQIFDNEAFLFKHSNEGMALLEQYRNGEISEEDFERIFREKVGPTIDEEFLGEITSEGGIMRDYFVVAREKLGKDTSKKGANAVDYAIQEYELEKEKEFDNKVREAYKEKYGVYPEDDKSVRYNAANDGLLFRWRRLEDIKSSVREQEQTGYRTSEITGETKEYRKDLPQILQISGAKEFNEDAKEIIDAVENKGLGDFFKAFGRTASDMDTWDLGISALLRNGALLEVVEKADRKEKLTREEQLLMDAALNYMAVSAFYSNSLGRGYKAGTTSAASIPFMIQFALSAGALSAMEASLTGTAKAAGTKLINALAKHGMQKMANVAASEATKAIGKASVGMLSSLIGAGALTAAWDIPSIASGSIERQIGDITPVYNKEGNAFVYGGREHKQSPKEATWNAFADKYVERLSEMVLAKTFAPIEAYASGTRMFKNIAKNDVIGAILDIRNTPFIKGLREKAMFGGLFEEMMEEELGGLLRMATMSDVNTFKEAGLDMDGQIDIFLGLAPTSLLFSVGGTASHYGKLAVRSKKLRDSLVTDAERKLFDNLMSESRSGKFGELAHDFIRNVILADRTKDGRKITNEDKRDALITVLTKYQDVLSEELKSQTKSVKKEENDAAIDNAVQNMRYKETDDIFFVKDENGKKYVIVDGNVGFNQIQGGLVVDSSRSDSHVSVREVLGNGQLGKVEKVRTASLTDNVHPMSTTTYTEWNQAKHQAEVNEKETFEYNGIVFDTATSKRLGTKEEYEKKKKEDEAVKNEGKPTIDTEPRKMKNEKFQLVVDGKKQSVTFYNAGLVQNEDGSINKEDSDLFIIEVNGEKVSRRNQEEYIDALSEHLKSEHAKAIEEYNQKQKASDNVESEAPTTALTDEDRAAAAAEQERKAKEAEKQSVLASAQQKKAKKYTPEEAVVVLMEQGNDVATRLVGSRINKLHTQIDEINADENKDELEKWEDSKELSDQLAEYEAAVVKWLGQETLDAINATRVAPAAPVVEAAPVEETPAAPPVQAPVVEPVQSETPVTAEPAVAPEEEAPQGELPAEPDTTPLPPAEPVETRTQIIDVEQDMADGKIKAYYSVNGGGQWYVVKDGAIVARSEKANKGDMPNNATEVKASLVYKDENGIKKPVILITTVGDYHNLRKKDAVIIDEYGLTTADTQSLYDSEVNTDESTGEEIEDFIQINQNTSERKDERKEIKKYTTLDSLLKFPLLKFRGNEVFTMKDLLELGYRTGSRKTVAKQKDGSRKPINKSVLYSPYDLVKGMLKEKYPNDTDVEIQERMNHFANQFQRAAVRWNELVASKHAGIEGLSIDNVNIQTSSTGDHQTAIAQFMMTASEAVNNGIITTKVSEKVDTLPKKFNPDTKDRIVSNRTNEEILDDVQQLEQEIESLEKLSEFEDTKKDIAAAKRKLNNLIKALSDSQAQFLSEQYKYGYVAEYLKKRMASKEQQEVDAPAGKEGDTTKETPAKPKANIDKLRDTFVEAYARTQNQSYNALQKTMAKTAFKGMIDKMSEEDAVALYLNLAMEIGNSQGKMQEDMANAAQALLDSKHGAAINAITGGAQQETNQTPVETTEVATGETEQTTEDAIDYEALVAERNELQETIYDMEDDEAANANARIAQINEMLRNRPEFMEGNVTESSASQEAKELVLAAEIQSLTDSEEIDVINVTAEQAEEAKRTGKPEMQISNETQRIFVSNAERAVESIKQEKATPQQWKAMIEKQGGLKAGEDKWLGLSEWLDNQDKKTLGKQEILDFIAKNRIIIEEVHYTDSNEISEEDVLNSEAFSNLLNELLDWSGDEPVIDMQKFRELKDDDDFVDGFDTDYWNETLIVRDPAKAAKYLGIANPINDVRLEYTTSGLDEKMEIAIVIPTIASWNRNDEIHFGDAGSGRAIAWVRFGETTDADGNRVLVIDEIQSKRHQEGREKGYYTSSGITDVESLKTRVTDLERMAFDIRGKLDTMNISVTPENMSNEDAAEYYKLQEELLFVRNNRDYDRINAEIDAIKSKYNQQDRENLDKKLKDINEELEKLHSALDKLNAKDRVPDAPFDKNWHELAMKRMLRYAAENGFDYVAWTTGEQQAERYNLGKQFDSIEREDNPSINGRRFALNGANYFTFVVNDEGIVTDSDMSEIKGKPLADVVGKDLAVRMMSLEDGGAIEGADLRIGGEGMKGFYDRMLPSFVSKYTKKWGAKVQDINLPELEESAQTMHAVNVTPEMEESVMEGQPMFSIESTPLMTSKGVIYGYALGNKIYLTPDGMNTNTPVHEYTHIWAKAMQKHNPKAWKSIVEQLKKAEALWNEVINDPNYKNIKNDEDAVASEVLSRYSGKNGAAKLEAEAERVVTEYKGMEKGLKVKALINRVKEALNQFWSWVGKDLFKIESFESVESIADRVLYDMLNNTQLNLDNSKKSSTFAQNNENYERNDERTMDGEVPSGSRRGESRTDSSNGEGRRLPVRDVPRANGGYDANVAQSVAEQSQLLSEMLTERGIKHTSQQVKLATPQEFYDAIIEAKQLNPHGWMVDAYGVEDYAGFTCLLTEDGKSGIAIKPNGDIISVFSSVKRDNRLQMLMPMAIMQGGRKLDCYYLQGENGNIYGLPKLYSTFGFKIAATTNFVEEYVPQEEYARWKEERNGSIQGVAAMYISDEVANDLINNYNLSATPNTNAQNFPSADTGYGEALAERDKLMILENARANGTIGTINGKKSNLPDELWAVVRTDAFKDWFGDWQNDPANASKVLDENGEPLVVYHGSKMAGFDEFQQLDESVNGFFTTDNKAGANTYATNREERRNNVMADEAQLNTEPHHGIYSLFANIKNPAEYDFAGKMYNEYGEPQGYYVDMSGEEWEMLPVPKFATKEEALAFARENGEPDSAVKTTYLSTDDLVEMAKAAGHDGVIFKNVLDGAEHNEEQPVMNDYIAFEPNQLKSATQNIGTFSSEDNRMEFMIGPAAPAGTPITDPTLMLDEEALKALEVKSKKYAAKLANPKVQLPEEISKFGDMVARNFDRTEGIRRIMNSIAEYRKAHGMPKMGEGFDVRTMIETKDSKINNKIASFDNNQVKRLEKIVRKWAKVIEKSAMYEKYKNEQMRNQDGEVTTLTPIEFLERYLIACDSIEREALTKNPRGIGGFLNRMGINVIQFHNEFVSEFASDTKGKKMREELWEAVRGVTRVTLEVGKESGLISQEEYDKDIKRQFYVPERDFAEVEANKQLWIEGAAFRKSKRGARLRAMQKSKEQGGLSLAANILSNMLDLTYDAIAKAEENKVKVAMFDLLSANEAWCNEKRVPVPVRVWYEKDADGKPVRRTTEPSRSEREEMKKYKGAVRKLENLILNETDKKLIYESKIDELKEELKKNHTPEERLDIETDIRELETLILQINDNIDEWHEDIDVYKSMYPYMDTIDVRNILFETKEQQKAETVIAYVDGVPCEMHFPNMQIVADALNNESYNDLYFDDIKKVTSYASAIFTVYNPTFFTVNLARDIPWILSKGYSEYGWQFPVRFAAKLVAETFSSTLWKAVAGKDYSDSIYAEHMKEFYEGGGNTGYTQLPEMQRIKKHVAKWGEKKLITWGDVGNVMSFMNEWSEVLTRSAAYSVVRDMGYSQEEGIRAAKNLSVNFNRKGLGSRFMNLFSSFSMFANAVVQGACGFYRTFKGNEDTQLQKAMHVTRAIMSIGFAPAFAGFMSTLLQPDDEDDFLVSDWERDNYLVLGDVRIPLSEQLKPFWCIGVNIALGMHGKRNGKDIARSLINSFFVNLVPAPNTFNSVLQMISDSIFGYRDFSGAALVDNLLTPQVLKNTNSIANNSNFMGGKFRYDYRDTPEFVMGENDPYIYRCMAELAYNMAGGDKHVNSTSVKVVNEYGEVDYDPMGKAMNVNPKQIEAWASVFVPSGIRDIANAVAVTFGKISGDEDAKFEPKEFNSVTRFYKQQDKELNQYFLLKDIKKEIEYYNYVKSTAKKNIIGAEITGNEEWLESAETKFENVSNNTLKRIEASLIEQYDKLHMDKIARKYALTGDELKEHLSDKEIIKIDKERDNILRKILILDMERKGNELFTYDDFEKKQKYSEKEKRDILESQIYNEVRKKRPK